MKSLITCFLLGGVAAAAPLELNLEGNVDQTVALDRTIRGLRIVSRRQPRLTLILDGKTRLLPLPTIAEGFFPKGNLLIADFNFDGRKDIGIPSGVGYGGTNVFYKVYSYSEEKGGHFLPILGGAEICNPKFSVADKTLICNSKSGPFWYGKDYRFTFGNAWLWRKREPLPSDSQSRTRFEVYDSEGKLQNSQISSNPDRLVPVQP